MPFVHPTSVFYASNIIRIQCLSSDELSSHFSSVFLGQTVGRISIVTVSSLQDSWVSLERAFSSLGYARNNIYSFHFIESYCSKNLPPVLRMDLRRIVSIKRSVDEGLIDLKINIQCLSDFVAIRITDNRETAKEVKQLVEDVRYVSYQTSCHDSRIDDNDINLKEMMGKLTTFRRTFKIWCS